LESGPGRSGSDPSGLGAAIWSGGSDMRQYPNSQTLLTGNMLEMDHDGSSLATLVTYSPSTPSISTPVMRHSAAMMGYSNWYGSGGASPCTPFPPPQSYRPISAKERRQRAAIRPRDREVEVEALQCSDNGRDRFLPLVDLSVPEETPHVEVGTVRRHTCP
jgi:hypothetical protein